jgi:hypothetical protein
MTTCDDAWVARTEAEFARMFSDVLFVVYEFLDVC